VPFGPAWFIRCCRYCPSWCLCGCVCLGFAHLLWLAFDQQLSLAAAQLVAGFLLACDRGLEGVGSFWAVRARRLGVLEAGCCSGWRLGWRSLRLPLLAVPHVYRLPGQPWHDVLAGPDVLLDDAPGGHRSPARRSSPGPPTWRHGPKRPNGLLSRQKSRNCPLTIENDQGCCFAVCRVPTPSAGEPLQGPLRLRTSLAWPGQKAPQPQRQEAF